MVFGVTAGVIAALNQNTRWDYSVMGLAMTGVVIPSFVVAPLLVMIFAIMLKWLPAGGLERRGAEIHDPANGGIIVGLHRQYRPYHTWFDD